MRVLQSGLLIMYLLNLSQASTGDRDFAFQQCVAKCETTGCAGLEPAKASKACHVACPMINGKAVPLSLQLFSWSCQDDCRYIPQPSKSHLGSDGHLLLSVLSQAACRYCCMTLRKLRTIAGMDGSTVKYYGKWPFQRVLGIQEVLSVIFSLANLVAHAHNLCKLQSACSTTVTAMAAAPSCRTLWVIYAVTSINAWWWSAVFHARDTHVTERFDYLSADISIMAGLYVSAVRTCACQSMRVRLLLAVLLMGATGLHFAYMLVVQFDYGLNVMLCVVVGIMQQLMWCVWALRHNHPQKRQLLWFVVLINAALSLEILDFPPLGGLLDAHALWHLCTVPLTYMWYSFVLADIKWAVQTTPQQSSTEKQL